jgi:hypothetical protein
MTTHTHHNDAVDVRLVGEHEDTRIRATDFTAINTFSLAGVAADVNNAQGLLPLDRYRRRAEILINQPAQLQTGFVLIGSRAQVSNGQGGRLRPGNRFVTEGMQALFFSGDGATAMEIVAIVERYSPYDQRIDYDESNTDTT